MKRLYLGSETGILKKKGTEARYEISRNSGKIAVNFQAYRVENYYVCNKTV